MSISATSLPVDKRRCHPCRREDPRDQHGSLAARRCAEPTCEAIFTPGYRAVGRPAQTFCSIRCRNRSANVARRSPTGRTVVRACEVCGSEFRGGRSDKPQRTCGRICGAELRRREYGWAGSRPPRPRVVKPPQACLWCGRSCPKGRRYCSPPCVRAVHPYAKRVSSVAYGDCVDCGASFVRRAHAAGDAFCSERCMRRVRRRNDRHVRRTIARRGDRITIWTLGERDLWRCHICLDPVAQARGNDDGSPSIDHLHPVSLGGTHTWGNVALAHRGCNSLRWRQEAANASTSV